MITTIQQERDNYFTLTTAKGKQIGVALQPWNHVSIYILRNGMTGTSGGKHFRSLCDAIDGYKSDAIKRALKDLARHLGAPSYIWA